MRGLGSSLQSCTGGLYAEPRLKITPGSHIIFFVVSGARALLPVWGSAPRAVWLGLPAGQWAFPASRDCRACGWELPGSESPTGWFQPGHVALAPWQAFHEEVFLEGAGIL